MDLSKRCAREFTSRDWQRGEKYFRDGAVRILEQWSGGLEAEVQGSASRPYDVRLDWSEARRQTLLVSCTCPRFDDVGICKHIAATILKADAQGIGGTVPGKSDLYVESESVDPDEYPDQDAYDFDDEDWDDDTSGPRSSRNVGSGSPRTQFGNGSLNVSSSGKRSGQKKQPASSPWKKTLVLMAGLSRDELSYRADGSGRASNKPREIWYLLNIARSVQHGWPSVSIRQRALKKNGGLGKLKDLKLTRDEVKSLASTEDQMLIGLLLGNEREMDYGYYGYSSYASYMKHGAFAVAPAMFEILLTRLCASGRFGWLPEDGESSDDQIRLLTWDDGPAWNLNLNVAKTADKKHWELSCRLQRDNEVEELSRPLVLMAAGLVVFPDRIARFDACGDFRWAAMLRNSGPLLVPVKEDQEFIEQLVQMQVAPNNAWPRELQWEEEHPVPVPQLKISRPKEKWISNLECRLSFQYGDQSAPFGGGKPAWYVRETHRAVHRNLEAEQAARDHLLSAEVDRYGYGRDEPGLYYVNPTKMSPLVLRLAADGWQVEAEGRAIRQPGQVSLHLTSNVDWFDLEAECDFGGVSASLPKLLAALRHGEKFVQLDDGSQGILPDEWIARYAPLADMGQIDGNRVKFLPTQAALLDALLTAQESQNVTIDKEFSRLRDKLHSFDGIRPCNEPRTFAGELRQYQREGLGWLRFLDEFGFGGCLADDMGLGKTVQILALLEGRRRRPSARGRANKARKNAKTSSRPSLVVVPRSLVFNWMEEARRFTPKLKVLNYTGLDRKTAWDQMNDHDLIVTTYGTVRRDIIKLRDFEFDYVILDEAQAIKNASSHAAKVCRLLRARRRLAMTGTPVENHLGELWSLFEFLNPGLLGRQPKTNGLLAGSRRRLRGPNGNPEKEDQRAHNLAVLSRGLRPFMLRRTKQQVLTELPDKTEQTLYCELGGAQRKLYDELRDHYRRSLLERVDRVGLNKSKIQVLEALLRLRQAACHPGLLDKKKIDAGSSKLETLLEQLIEVIAEGHKALVFSQFTSLLAIVRGELDRQKIIYEYLDGKTVKRQSKVERFQIDSSCRLFLISLKAGGQGLNLTAADYVFILDPWWNPAVEAQAVDRAHRIGQDRHVFAYRLIARDTVEEKILQLQEQKRDLAEAIISADKNILRNLTAEDLQLLLG